MLVINLDFLYYIAPTDKIGQEAFAVIRETMRGKKVLGIGRVVIARRERPIMLEPFGKGILGTTLRYPYEVRDAEGYFEDVPDIKLSEEIRELAAHILETKRADFDPAKFEDSYETALVAMLKSKQAGMPMKAEAPPRPTNVVNLLDALRRSIAAEKPAPAPSVSERRKPPASAKAGRKPRGRTRKRA
ncbi:MAG: Ku protein [Rhodoplanes sp.]